MFLWRYVVIPSLFPGCDWSRASQKVLQMNNMRRVAVKEYMIVTNALCQRWRGVCHPLQLVVISDVNKPEQIVRPVGCQCQTIVDRKHCRNICHAGNLSLLSIAEEVGHETLRQSFYAGVSFGL